MHFKFQIIQGKTLAAPVTDLLIESEIPCYNKCVVESSNPEFCITFSDIEVFFGKMEAATVFLVRYPTEKSWAFYHLLKMKNLGLTVVVEKTNCLEEQRFLIQYT